MPARIEAVPGERLGEDGRQEQRSGQHTASQQRPSPVGAGGRGVRGRDLRSAALVGEIVMSDMVIHPF